MIVEGLLDIITSLIFGLFSTFEIVKLPLELIGVLSTILQYGVWVVGADVMALVFSSVFAWWGIKFTVGIVLWLWELLPLT